MRIFGWSLADGRPRVLSLDSGTCTMPVDRRRSARHRRVLTAGVRRLKETRRLLAKPAGPTEISSPRRRPSRMWLIKRNWLLPDLKACSYHGVTGPREPDTSKLEIRGLFRCSVCFPQRCVGTSFDPRTPAEASGGGWGRAGPISLAPYCETSDCCIPHARTRGSPLLLPASRRSSGSSTRLDGNGLDGYFFRQSCESRRR